MNIGCNISERASTLSSSNGEEKELPFNRKKLARGGEERKQNKTQKTKSKLKSCSCGVETHRTSLRVTLFNANYLSPKGNFEERSSVS